MRQRRLDYESPYPDGLPGHVQGDGPSIEAAVSMLPVAGNLQRQVYDFIDRGGGATCEEVEMALGLRHQTASARIRELALAGHVASVKKRRNVTGRRAWVWESV